MSHKKTGRNSLDVVMELIGLHFKHTVRAGDIITEEDIKEIYKKYHDLVKNTK